MRGTWCTAIGALWLTFTGSGSAWADAPQSETGARVRSGTVVGYADLDGVRATAIGAQIAVGQRVGPITLEAELDATSLIDGRDDDIARRGNSRRLGVTGRVDVLTVGSRLIGPRSALVLWLEAGLGRHKAQWEDAAAVRRNEGHVGFGWLLDHRINRNRRIPAFGWHVGWRFSAAPIPDDSPNTIALCKAKACAPSDTDDRYDLGFLVSSSIVAHW